MDLNERAWQLCDALVHDAAALRVEVHHVEGARIVDCGIRAAGGLEAGRRLAEVCLAGLGSVQLVAGHLGSAWAVEVRTDQPAVACMAAQYAGWQISLGRYFAMGSGPMRVAGSSEPLIDELGFRQQAARVVGVLETAQLPPAEVCHYIAQRCAVSTQQLTLLVAPTASLAGCVQVAARSVETALHKLHALGYDLRRVHSGLGRACLPPVAADDLAALGRTNDAILYGGLVTLWVRDDDEALQQIGPRLPSSASPDAGRPFVDIFEAHGRDFYRIDPALFSPAVVELQNLSSGRTFRFGQWREDVLRASFGGA
jgi:methenyltetrahydromethanopterin cyclohydrolase